MTRGEQLIRDERKEHMDKHGFSLDRDAEYYENGELVQAALFCEEQAEKNPEDNETREWPEGWDVFFANKVRNKTKVGKYTVAGSFYLAEFDRTGEKAYLKQMKKMARKINVILS